MKRYLIIFIACTFVSLFSKANYAPKKTHTIRLVGQEVQISAANELKNVRFVLDDIFTKVSHPLK